MQVEKSRNFLFFHIYNKKHKKWTLFKEINYEYLKHVPNIYTHKNKK